MVFRSFVCAALVLASSIALAQDAPDGGAPPPPPEVPPREAFPPRVPLGVPQVMGTKRALGGPVIELPPDEPAAAAPAQEQRPVEPSPERTSQFSTLMNKAAAIVNRTVLGGYGEFAFTKRQAEDSYFEARRLVAFLFSPIWENHIFFATEIEFEHGGSPLKKDGAIGAGEVQLEFATLDIKFVDQLTLRGGIILVPMGRFNINHDAPTQDLTDRPLVMTYIIPTTWFEVGVGLTGTHKFKNGISLDHEVYVINGLDSQISDGQGYRAARGSKLQDNNDDKAVVGRVGMRYFGPIARRAIQLDFGLSGYEGAYNREGARTWMLAADLALRVAGFELVAEYARGWNGPGFNDDWPGALRTPVPQDLYGFFVEAHYHIMPEALRRRLPSWMRESVFTLSLRYDLIDTDMSQLTVAGDRQRLSFGLNYRFIEAVAWKHELQLDVDGKGAANPFDHPQLGYVSSFAFLF